MDSSWIPTWVAVAWTVVFAGVLAIHLRNMVALRRMVVVTGRSRLWHGVHVLMALGMIDMYWPTGTMPVGARPAQVVYAGAAAGLGAMIAIDAVRYRRPVWLWTIAVVDMVAMAYMFLLTSIDALAAVTVLLAVWSVAQSLGWASGFLATAAPYGDSAAVQATRVLGGHAPAPDTAARASAGGQAPATSTAVVAAAVAGPVARPVTVRAAHTRPSRVTLTLMNVGMAYMLLAMQFGMATGGSPGMPGMHGM